MEYLWEHQKTKVAYIPTAFEIYKEAPWAEVNRKLFSRQGFTMIDTPVSRMTKDDLISKLGEINVLFIEGGNTTYLLQKCLESGLCELILSLVETGVVYIGSSAGSIVAGPTIAPFIPEDMKELPRGYQILSDRGFGLVPEVVLPHYDTGEFAAENDMIKAEYGSALKLVPLNDDQYLEVTGGKVELKG